jgi:hypothetical protein
MNKNTLANRVLYLLNEKDSYSYAGKPYIKDEDIAHVPHKWRHVVLMAYNNRVLSLPNLKLKEIPEFIFDELKLFASVITEINLSNNLFEKIPERIKQFKYIK